MRTLQIRALSRSLSRSAKPLATLLVVAWVLGASISASIAQPFAATSETPAAAAETSPTPAAEPPDAALRVDLERLLRQLEDPEQARRLANGLRSLLEAAKPGAPDPDAAVAADGESGELAPDDGSAAAKRLREAVEQARPAAAELLARIEASIRERFMLVRQALEQMYRTAQGAPAVLAWTTAALDEPEEWRAVASEAGTLVAILGTALLAMWLVSRALAPARDALGFREQDRLMSRVVIAAGLVLLRAIPILGFALIANALILAFAPDRVTTVVLSSGVSAILAVRVGMVLVQAILSPAAAAARLVPLSDDAARLLTAYIHWFLALIIYGHTLVSVLRWYGLPWAFEGTLLRLIALIVFVTSVWIVIKRRRAVAEALSRLATDTDNGGAWWRMPWRRVGAVWHVFVLLYLIALFVIYTIQGEALFLRVFSGSMLSLAVLAGLVVALRYVERTSAELALTPDADDEDLDPMERGKHGAPRSSMLAMGLRLAILLVAVFTFLQVWGLGTWDWLLFTSGGFGQKVIDVGIVVVVSYGIWLVINRFITGYITRLDAETATLRSSNRTRTALVLARNALLVTLYLIAGLVILSELGVNIAPLLAGAGVLGIAVGFGSQRLVQDVISGLFNLLEDTFAVGDVVDLGGKSGVVEAVTIRTVRLRDLGGNVHTIPFGAIDVVTNMTKDFAFALFDVGVAYRENVDQVMDVIRDVGADIRRDRAYRRVILEPLEMLGLDQFADSAVVIRCRLKVRAGSQWMVGREFNRRLKNRFDELGIEIPFPHQTVYFGEDRGGQAPPARVVVGTADASSAERQAPQPSPPAAAVTDPV